MSFMALVPAFTNQQVVNVYISTQPSNVSASGAYGTGGGTGTTNTATVVAMGGSGSYTYQWYITNTVGTGTLTAPTSATTAVQATVPAATTDSGTLYCVVNDGTNTATSNTINWSIQNTSPTRVSITIIPSGNNVNVFSLRGGTYIAGISDITVQINNAIGSTSTSIPALDTGSGWTSGDTITIKGSNSIVGCGGDGADGNTSTGANGNAGGTALNLQYNVAFSGYTGVIGGGGGGGASGGGCYYTVIMSGKSVITAIGGSGGGGGAGSTGGNGGAGGIPTYGTYNYRGNTAATASTPSTSGQHGGAATNTGAAGTGGAVGVAGGNGANSSPNGGGAGGGGGGLGAGGGSGGNGAASTGTSHVGYSGGAGGAGGYAIAKNGHSYTGSPGTTYGTIA